MKIKTISALLAASMFIFPACDGLTGSTDVPTPDPNPDTGTEEGDKEELLEGEVVLNVSKTLMLSDGLDYVDFEVLVGGVPVDSGFTIYDGNNKRVELPAMMFTTTEPGKYEFWASYGTRSSRGNVVIRAIDCPALPELAADPEPENLSFVRRVFLAKFTGTGCGYCPYMTVALHETLADKSYADKVVLAEAHTFNSDDPAYYDDRSIAAASGVDSYPTLMGDYYSTTGYYYAAYVQSFIDFCYNRTDAKAGISVSSVSDGQTMVVAVSVKAAETGEYKVGAWLLEDGIYGVQYGTADESFYTHNNCLRIADSKYSNTDYTGHELGEIEAGKTMEYVFVWDINEAWVAENLHFAVFVSAKESNSWAVTNAVGCEFGEQLGFEYE